MHVKYIALCLILFSCYSIPVENKLSGIKATQVSPEFDYMTGKLLGYDTSSVYIFRYKDLHLYKLKYGYSNTTRDTMFSEKRYHYFVYREGEQFGYDYDIHKPSAKPLPKDSMFENEWVVQNKFCPIFGNGNEVKLLSTDKTKDGEILRQSYFIKNPTAEADTGRVFLEFKKSMNNADFSLCQELDNKYKMKLVSIRILFGEKKASGTVTFDKFQTFNHFSIADDFDKNEILSYFEKFESEKR